MANLRVKAVEVVDSLNLKATFTAPLIENLSLENISIESESVGTPNPSILSITIDGNVLSIESQPLTELAAYYIVFKSTQAIRFSSLNGDALLLEDGVANRFFFLGPVSDDNVVKNYLLSYLRSNVYNTESGTELNKYISNLSLILSKALYDIKQTGNENYLSKTIIDEVKTRGIGPFDRLDEEGAYEIFRIGKTPTNASSSITLSFENFPSFPVSLLKTQASDELTPNSVDGDGTFNPNSFVLNLRNSYITRISSIVFIYSDIRISYVYDIDKYGYQILDSKYDRNRAFDYFLLKDNQVRLSDKVLADPAFSLENILKINITYEHKDTGRVIDSSTISVNAFASSGREVVPAIRNTFNLKHAPIVSTTNGSGSVGDVKFIDPNTLEVLNASHPAFSNELPFRLDALPNKPGDYSVNYKTGQVYVYGQDAVSAGTGNSPPIAIYKYQIDYKENIDFTIQSDENDLVALPNGSAIGSDIEISFSYEQNLAKNIDYVANLHKESLNERIGSGIVALNALTTANSGITDVFRIYNETTGELYKPVRWNNNKVYFTYNNPPNIEEVKLERAAFDLISNETLSIQDTTPGEDLYSKIYHINLNNNRIMAATEDALGSSFNSSLSFTKPAIFQKEIYFNDRMTLADNLSRLSIGSYQVDYQNGVVYVAIGIDSEESDIGSVYYKRAYIKPQFPHVTSVSDIFYQIDLLSNKERSIDYVSFEDGLILPSSIDSSSESFLTDESTNYVTLNGQIGSFEDSQFISGVKDNIKYLRGIYEIDDLLGNPSPLNFASSSSFAGKNVIVSPISFQEYHSVASNGGNKQVSLNTGLQYVSPNVQVNVSVRRLSDNVELWNPSGTFQVGSHIVLTLASGTPANVGDSVVVKYSFSIADLSHVVADYSRGDYYVAYEYLADEILISYEYGDNKIDFRKSTKVLPGDIYYTSYRVGALRAALLKNFGSLIDIPILNSFDVLFDRERYRDGISAAMHSLGKGPTASSIKAIAQTISHLPAELIETAFSNWSLGNSSLYQQGFKSEGNLRLAPLKHSDGIIIDSSSKAISLPAAGNLSLESGTFEAWVKPFWNGIDNDAGLTLSIIKNGQPVPNLQIFVGASENHPTISIDPTTNLSVIHLKKDGLTFGMPNKHKDGVYVYLNKDASNKFDRWFIDIIDGYNSGSSKNYTITALSSGRFYDLKNTSQNISSTSTRSDEKKITFSSTGLTINSGMSFVAGVAHYIWDVGGKFNQDRLSLFVDEFGYLNFRTLDSNKNDYTLSADVSSWKPEELHQIAASWKLNTIMGRDEMHLFIDGFEVPNLIKYGDRHKAAYKEKYRTVNPEEIVGMIPKSIIGSNDLKTTAASNQVLSSLNFSSYGAGVGDRIYIEEDAFNPNGYLITNVNGNTLSLAAVMPATISNGKFSVNKTRFQIRTEAEAYSNVSVSLLHALLGGGDLETHAGSSVFTSSASNFTSLGVLPGYLIGVSDARFEKHYSILQVSGHNLTIDGYNAISATGLSFNVYPNTPEEIPGPKSLQPAYEFARDGYSNNEMVLRSSAEAKDIVLINTHGLNRKQIRHSYYVWGSYSQVLKTHLPAPISLDNVSFKRFIKKSIVIGPSNSTLSAGKFQSQLLYPDSQPNTVANGRTISFAISGMNVDFSTPTVITISGVAVNRATGASVSKTETLSFSKYGIQSTVNQYQVINSFSVNTKPINSSSNALILEVKEKYSMTDLENKEVFSSGASDPDAVIRYAYQMYQGTSLSSDGSGSVADDSVFFSSLFKGDSLIIHSPPEAAGFYPILDISEDHHSLILGRSPIGSLPPAFTGGYYEVLNTTKERTGLANGYFVFEFKYLPGQPLFLSEGLYEIEYFTYVNIPINITGSQMFFGTDINGNNSLNGVMGEVRLLANKLDDVRVGETVPNNQRSITKDFNSVKATNADITTLVQADFDTLPLINSAEILIGEDKRIIKSGNVINENFSQSILLTENPIVLDNDGIVNYRSQGTIEFWVNPLFDTMNDPNDRYYLDVSSNVSLNIISKNKTTIILPNKAFSIHSIRLQVDSTGFDYVAGAILQEDKQTIRLIKALPNQNTPLTISYVANGMKGDRISIFKDKGGYLNFQIDANLSSYTVRAPTYWVRNSWHRVKASYTVNSPKSTDEMHLSIDGYEYSHLSLDGSANFSNFLRFGTSNMSLNARISLKDSLNQIFIGSDNNLKNRAYCLMDNIRFSNIMRPAYAPFGEPIDPNYQSNLDMVYPVTEDAVTTLLLDYNALKQKANDFTLLNNKNSSLSDFTLNVFDGFDIIKDNVRSKEILESLVKNFKPANARAFINYSD